MHVISGDGSHLLGKNVDVAMGLVKRIAELKEHKTPYPNDVGIPKTKIMLKERCDSIQCVNGKTCVCAYAL